MSDASVVYVDEELEDLIPGFLENRQNDIAAISDLLDNDNFEEIQRIGHSMKGSGGGYGFDEVTVIGRKIEAAAIANDQGKIKHLTDHLSDYLSNVEIIYREED